MSGSSEQTGTDQQISDLQAQLNTLTEENRNLKAAQTDVSKLHNAISQHVADKAKLANEKVALETAFADFKTAAKTKELTLHLDTALSAAGAKNPNVVKKLLDLEAVEYDEDGGVKQESIAALIAKVQETDSYMFGEVDPKKATSTATTNGQLPKPHHVADKLNKGSFETEMDAAVKSGKQEQVEAVFAKYHNKT